MKLDCRLYMGDRPCQWGGDCEGCDHYAPMGTRILVVKLAAAGDVLRATSVLAPLKASYPESHVTWVADPAALPLIRHNPYLDRAMPFGFETWLVLSAESFDLAVCLDKEPRAGAFVQSMSAERQLGFGTSAWGTTEARSDGARYDLELGLSNEKKFFVNEKTYPEICCDIAEVDYTGEPYALALPDESIEYAREFLAGLGAAEPVVGLNVGAGDVFANKAWTPEGFAELAGMIRDRLGGTALVLGGPDKEEERNRVLKLAGAVAVDGSVHELLDFAAIVGSLDALVTGDTMAMHIAVAMGVPVVAIFGPTVHQEIDLYGRGKKIITTIECAPCYRRSCDRRPTCMEMISADDVFGALEEVLKSG